MKTTLYQLIKQDRATPKMIRSIEKFLFEMRLKRGDIPIKIFRNWQKRMSDLRKVMSWSENNWEISYEIYKQLNIEITPLSKPGFEAISVWFEPKIEYNSELIKLFECLTGEI